MAGRVVAEAFPDRAVVRGFDHSTAWLGVIGLGGAVGMAAAAMLEAGPAWGIGGLAGLAALTILPSRLLRFRVEMSRTMIRIEKGWGPVTFARHEMTLAGTRFAVRGTGDWGEDGGWPARRYREIEPRGRTGIAIGTPEAAEEIRDFLAREQARLLAWPADAETTPAS